ncbi:MAG: M50 family metallopeptidase [Gemmatimonadota bacterium]
MLVGGFGVGRWFGFRIRIDYSWFVVFALVLWTFSAWEFPVRLPGLDPWVYGAMGTAGAALFFLSVLLHELSHAAMARARGVEVEGITLFIFGGVAQMRMEARRPADEFLITAVGPLSSLVLSGTFALAAAAIRSFGGAEILAVVADFLAILNLVLALFNLVPAFPLDGGRILRSAVWQATGDLARATRWAAMGGRVFGFFLMFAGFLLAVSGYLLSGVWAGFLGWFLANAAVSSLRGFVMRRALAGVPVSRLLRSPSPSVEADVPASEAARVFLGVTPDALPVTRGDRAVGLLALSRVAQLDDAARRRTPVSAIMTPLADLPRARPEEALDRVIGRMEGSEARILVIDEDRLVGTIGLAEIRAWAERSVRLDIAEGGDRPRNGGDG